MIKFRIEQTELAKALNHAVKITSKAYKETLMINVKLSKLNDNTVRLLTFNGITTLQYDLQADNVEGDCILFKADYLASIINRLSGVISFNDGNIKAGKCKYKIPFVNDEFPLEELTASDDVIIVNTKDLISAIAKTLYSSASDGTGPLTGIYLNGKDVVSTDGNRMTIVKTDKELPSCIIPKELCKNIIKLFDSEEIKIDITDRFITIHNDNIFIRNGIISGRYPNYEALLPKSFIYEVKLDKSDLLNSLNVLMPVLQQVPAMICTLEFYENTCKISAEANGSESSIDFIMNDYMSEPFKISFNAQYLLDMLKNYKETIEMKLNNALSATVITENDIYSLIMPITKRD